MGVKNINGFGDFDPIFMEIDIPFCSVRYGDFLGPRVWQGPRSAANESPGLVRLHLLKMQDTVDLMILWVLGEEGMILFF